MLAGTLEFAGTDRFRVIRPIGEGGMGMVFEAEDLIKGQLVAVKTLKGDDLETLYRLKREFRSLADLSHPNLVDLYEMFMDDDQCFITMELIEGTDFIRYCRPHDSDEEHHNRAFSRADTAPPDNITMLNTQVSSHLFDEQRLRAALPQLVRALMAVHDAGLVHRDIKPPNVLVTHSARVVVLDFGLVANISKEGGSLDSLAGRIVGTVEYMAPEQAAADHLTPFVDWYAVGVLLYETLTGRVPHHGRVMDVLIEKQERLPTPPKNLVPQVPDDLNALCMELLSIEPGGRPSGSEILRRLGSDDMESRMSPLSSATELMPFTGRDEEVGRLNKCFDRVLDGEAQAVAIRGPSGIGKSALVRFFIDLIRQRVPEVVIIEGRCYESEVVPFKAMDAVIDQLTQHWSKLPKEQAAALLPGDAPLLPKLFPMLGRVPAIAAAPRMEVTRDPHDLRSKAYAALRHVFRRLAAQQPLVVVLDDLQWGDIDSLTLLSELMRQPNSPRMLLLMSSRDDARATVVDIDSDVVHVDNTALDGLYETLPGLDILELGPLSVKASTELAGHLLHGHGADTLAERIAEEAGGVPFFVSELAYYMQTVAPGRTGPVSLSQVLSERIEHLEDGARDVMELVAVAGEPISQRVAASAVGVSPETLARVIRHLRTVNLLRAPGGRVTDRVECYHSRIREAVRRILSPAAQKAHHRQLAIALEQWSEGSDERLASHWEGAGENVRAADYARGAAEQALEKFEFDRAARLFAMTLELGEFEESERCRLQTALADALANAGRPADAAAAYVAATENAEPIVALELSHRSATELLRGGYLEEGVAALVKVLDAVGIEISATDAGTKWTILWRRFFLRLRGLRWQPRDEADIPQRVLLEMDICHASATAFAMIDTARSFEFQTRFLQLALKHGEPKRVARALASETCYLAASGQFSRAEKIIELAERVIKEVGDEQSLTFTLWSRGAIHLNRDSAWRSALKQFRATIALLRRQNRVGSWEFDTVLYFSFIARLMLGQLDELTRRIPQYVAAADRRGDRYCSVSLRLRFTIIHLVEDDPDSAEADINRAIENWGFDKDEYLVQHHWELLGRCDIALYRGQPSVARELFTACEPRFNVSILERISFIRYEFHWLRGRTSAAVALAMKPGQNRMPEIARVEQSAKVLRRTGTPHGMAVSITLDAMAARARGDTEKAAEHLRKALGQLESLESHLIIAAVRMRLGQAVGGDEGRDHIEQADAWFKDQHVVAPAAFCQAIVPW